MLSKPGHEDCPGARQRVGSSYDPAAIDSENVRFDDPKQTQKIALSSIYQARSGATVESLVAAVSSAEFLSASAKIYANKSDELTMQEAVAWEYYLGAEMTLFEDNHQQYEMGFLSEEHWQRNITELKCKFELPLNRQMMENWFYRESFMNLIDEIVDQVSRKQTFKFPDFL